MAPLLTIKSLSKSFNSGQDCCQIFTNFDFVLQAGKILAIVGESGSGKTTLLNLIAGFDSVDCGKIVCCGFEVTNLNEKQLAGYRNQSLGFIFQSHFLLADFSVIENVMMPGFIANKSRSRLKSRAYELLEKVRILDKKNLFPRQLSGGECQRVAIARALMNDPDLILADEPTGSLDGRNAKIVQDLLFQLVNDYGKTLIIVTHNLELAGECQDCLKLQRVQA